MMRVLAFIGKESISFHILFLIFLFFYCGDCPTHTRTHTLHDFIICNPGYLWHRTILFIEFNVCFRHNKLYKQVLQKTSIIRINRLRPKWLWELTFLNFWNFSLIDFFAEVSWHENKKCSVPQEFWVNFRFLKFRGTKKSWNNLYCWS